MSEEAVEKTENPHVEEAVEEVAPDPRVNTPLSRDSMREEAEARQAANGDELSEKELLQGLMSSILKSIPKAANGTRIEPRAREMFAELSASFRAILVGEKPIKLANELPSYDKA
jgi:hypothetical protein